VQYLLEPIGAIHDGGLVQGQVDGRDGGEIDDGAVPEIFPDVCSDKHIGKELLIAEKEDRLHPERLHDLVHDARVGREDIDQDAGKDDPGQEVWHIDDGLDGTPKTGFPDKVQKDGEQNRHQQTQNDFHCGDEHRVPEHLIGIRHIQHIREVFQTDKG